MKAEKLTNPVVRVVLIAMRDGNREEFFAAFAPSAELTDDNQPQPLADWAEREVVHSHAISMSKGKTMTAWTFHSDQLDIDTAWRFQVKNGRVLRLDIAAV